MSTLVRGEVASAQSLVRHLSVLLRHHGDSAAGADPCVRYAVLPEALDKFCET